MGLCCLRWGFPRFHRWRGLSLYPKSSGAILCRAIRLRGLWCTGCLVEASRVCSTSWASMYPLFNRNLLGFITCGHPGSVIVLPAAPIYTFVGQDAPGGLGEYAFKEGASQGMGEGIVPWYIQAFIQPETIGQR